MGAWGDRPEDNDGSHDDFATVQVAAARAAEKLFKKQRVSTMERWERVGVVQLMIRLMPGALDYMQDVLKVAREDLDIILMDADFIKEWKNPSAIRKSAKVFLNQIEKILENM